MMRAVERNFEIEQQIPFGFHSSQTYDHTDEIQHGAQRFYGLVG